MRGRVGKVFQGWKVNEIAHGKGQGLEEGRTDTEFAVFTCLF